MLGQLTLYVFVAAFVLWALIIGIFVFIKIRDSLQRKKYSNVSVPESVVDQEKPTNKGL